MVTIRQIENGLIVNVDGKEMVLPFNEVIVFTDESDLVLFRSASNNDILFSAVVDNIQINGASVTKDTVGNVFASVANKESQGGGGAVIEKDLYRVVSVLPSSGEADILYLVPKADSEGDIDRYDEYLWVNGKFELVGSVSADIDLSGYYTKEQVDQSIGDAYAYFINMVDDKADKNNVYTKNDIDDRLNTLVKGRGGNRYIAVKRSTEPDSNFVKIYDSNTGRFLRVEELKSGDFIYDMGTNVDESKAPTVNVDDFTADIHGKFIVYNTFENIYQGNAITLVELKLMWSNNYSWNGSTLLGNRDVYLQSFGYDNGGNETYFVAHYETDVLYDKGVNNEVRTVGRTVMLQEEYAKNLVKKNEVYTKQEVDDKVANAGGGLDEETEEAIASAFNDLESRKLDRLVFGKYVEENKEDVDRKIDSVTNEKLEAYVKAEDYESDCEVISSALADLDDRIKNAQGGGSSDEQELKSLREDVENALGEIATLEADKLSKTEADGKFATKDDLNHKANYIDGNPLADIEIERENSIKVKVCNQDGYGWSTFRVNFPTINGQSLLHKPINGFEDFTNLELPTAQEINQKYLQKEGEYVKAVTSNGGAINFEKGNGTPDVVNFKTINNQSIFGMDNINVPTVWSGSQSQYDALGTYDSNTLYLVLED